MLTFSANRTVAERVTHAQERAGSKRAEHTLCGLNLRAIAQGNVFLRRAHDYVVEHAEGIDLIQVRRNGIV